MLIRGLEERADTVGSRGSVRSPCCLRFLSIFPFLSVTLGRSLLLNTMLLLIAQGMTETVPRGERVGGSISSGPQAAIMCS